MRRGHTVHVITKAVPGYPVHDEEYQGLYIHRWVRTSSRGPLFALSFVSGVIRAIRRLRAELDVVHTHQGLWEAVATGLAHPRRPGSASGIPTLVQPASSGYYGEADELNRTRGSSLWPQPDPAEHRLRGHLGGDRAPVAAPRRSGRTADPDDQRC